MIILYTEDVHEKYCLYTYLFYTNTALNNEPKKENHKIQIRKTKDKLKSNIRCSIRVSMVPAVSPATYTVTTIIDRIFSVRYAIYATMGMLFLKLETVLAEHRTLK